MGDSGGETARALLAEPGALWELVQAICNGTLSVADLAGMLRGTAAGEISSFQPEANHGIIRQQQQSDHA
jgi:hypothetical protein